MRILVEIGLLIACFVPLILALLSVLYDLLVRDCLSFYKPNPREDRSPTLP